MILICVIPFTESLTTGPGHVICIKGYVVLICLTLFTESLTKGPGHVMCISMYMYMYLNYDLISTTLLRKRRRIDDFSQSYRFCRVSIFVWLWFPVLYFMPYILGTFFVLTPSLRGLRFMPRRYSQMISSHYRRCSSWIGSSICSWSVAESEFVWYVFWMDVRDFADSVVGIGCQSVCSSISWYVGLCYVMKFCIIIDLFDLKATRKEIAENFAMYFILFDLKSLAWFCMR